MSDDCGDRVEGEDPGLSLAKIRTGAEMENGGELMDSRKMRTVE